jgi:hypothetical protein
MIYQNSTAYQYGLGLTYTDILLALKFVFLGLKSIDLRLNHYTRSDGLSANIGSLGFKFVVNKTRIYIF